MDIRDEIFGLNCRETSDFAIGLADVLVGLSLGHGVTRNVFELTENKVLKIAHALPPQANLLEWSIWEQFQYTPKEALWLAECHDISSCGRFLIQERLTPFTSLDDPRLPTKIPAWFTDTKIQNWGISKEGTVKCLDYGFSLLLQNNPWRLVKADWWSD